jgi:precorrin-6B methylase 2
MAAEHVGVGPDDRLRQMVWGFAPPLIVSTAVDLGIFDALEARPLTLSEAAAATGASIRGLAALLNALVGLGLLEKIDGDRYRLAPEYAAFLLRSRPETNLGPMFGHVSRQLVPSWLGLAESVRSGRPCKRIDEAATGADFFAQFVEALFAMAYPSARALAEHLAAETPGPVRVLDLAAGSGVWGIALAQGSPHVSITAVDWPAVLKITQRVAKRYGVADRLETVAGDLLEADFGAGHNVAVLGHILHSEGETRGRRLLQKTFAALAPGGRIAIAEFLVNRQRTEPVVGLLFAVNMLVHSESGSTWSAEEIGVWLSEAGFNNVRPLPVPGSSPLILADRP